MGWIGAESQALAHLEAVFDGAVTHHTHLVFGAAARAPRACTPRVKGKCKWVGVGMWVCGCVGVCRRPGGHSTPALFYSVLELTCVCGSVRSSTPMTGKPSASVQSSFCISSGSWQSADSCFLFLVT